LANPLQRLVTRRAIVATGLGAAAGAVGLGAVRAAARVGLIPPDSGGIFGIGETLTYASQRLFTGHGSLAREFSRNEISHVIPVNGPPPETETYQRLLAGGFADWRLTVNGLVERPRVFSLVELRALPTRSQITHQACEEGWSFIAEWTGVPLPYLLNLVGVSRRARYVVFFPFDQSWDSLDMADAWHPQTLLAHAMNGQGLPPPHGAPLRLRVPRQLGYKSVKYLSRITVVDTLADIGSGLGSISPEVGYSWYAGI
jgi:DMSO/TMAO reductase YedYZ molybdopterin-dependent catalytic subunit